jgi:hypothetical protein
MTIEQELKMYKEMCLRLERALHEAIKIIEELTARGK